MIALIFEKWLEKTVTQGTNEIGGDDIHWNSNLQIHDHETWLSGEDLPQIALEDEEEAHHLTSPDQIGNFADSLQHSTIHPEPVLNVNPVESLLHFVDPSNSLGQLTR